MGRDHRNIEMDWLDVRGFVEWSTNEVTQATVGQTRFWEYKDAVSTRSMFGTADMDGNNGQTAHVDLGLRTRVQEQADVTVESTFGI